MNNLHPRVTEEDIVVSKFSHLQIIEFEGLWKYAGGSHGDSHSSSLYLQELFCVCGALKRARLVRVGVAEVVFVRKEDAVSAYRKYNNRCLDGEFPLARTCTERAFSVMRTPAALFHALFHAGCMS